MKSPTLTASGATATSLKLIIVNHSGSWYYKYTTPGGGQCSSAVSGTTAVASGLQGGTSYIFEAYSDSSCATKLAAAAAVSTSATSLIAGSSSIAQTTATLTIDGHTAAWRYRYTKPSGGSCSNEVAAGTSSASLTGLSANTSYTFKAYSDSTCSTEITSDTTDADFLTKVGKPSKPTATAGAGSGALTLSSSSVTDNGALIKWQYTTDDGTSWSNIPSTSAILSYIVTALSNGTSYTFKVRAVNAAGPGLASDASDSATPVPATLTAGVAATSLKLTIANWSGNWYYKYTTPTGGQCSSTISGATAIATGLASNTSYTFKTYSDSSCSMELATAAATSTLVAVTLSAINITHNAATLIIANHSGNWYYKADAGLSTASCSSVVSSGTSSASLTGLSGNTSYTFKAYSNSSCSAEITADTTDADFLTKPAKPSRLTVTSGAGSGKLTVSSSLTGGSGTLEKWQYTTDDGTSWKDVTTATGNNLNVVVSTQSNGTALTNGTSYTFKVRAVNTAGSGVSGGGTVTASQASDAVVPRDETLSALRHHPQLRYTHHR